MSIVLGQPRPAAQLDVHIVRPAVGRLAVVICAILHGPGFLIAAPIDQQELAPSCALELDGCGCGCGCCCVGSE